MLVDQMKDVHPLVIRTSPQGQKFLGTCQACGATNLTMAQTQEPCPQAGAMTKEDALLMAIGSGGRG